MSSLDPQLFASVDELVGSLLRGEPSIKITPVDVARQLDEWAAASVADAVQAEATVPDRKAPSFRRVATDGAITAGLGRFFARKLRAGVLFGIFDRTGEPRAREEALGQYREARRVWAELAAGPADAYVGDITFGFDPHLRGHWRDRLAAIDRDIAAIETRPPEHAGVVSAELVAAAISAVLDPRPKRAAAVEHTPVGTFVPGHAISILARIPSGALSVRLQYRHLNQAETYRALDMERDGASWRAEVPGAYTQSPYPLQYYFEVWSADGVALWPGFKRDFLGQPYFVSTQA